MNSHNSDELSARNPEEATKTFAIRIVKLFRALPTTDGGRVIGKQLLCVQAPQSRQITGQFADLDRKLNSSLKLGLLLRKPTKQSFGWNFVVS